MSVTVIWKEQLLGLIVSYIWKQDKTHKKPKYTCSKGLHVLVKFSENIFEDKYPSECKLCKGRFCIVLFWAYFFN